MNMARRYFWVVLISLAVFATGCSRPGNHPDSQVASEVQAKILADPSVPEKQLTISSNNGIVTLSGNVSSDAVRTAAANDAAQVDGVKTVVNNLQVAPAMAASTEPPQAANNNLPAPPPQESKPLPSRPRARRSAPAR